MISHKNIQTWALLSVVTVISCFFLSRWIIEGAYFQKDLVFITAPLENLYGSIQRSGESPLWAPELAGGYPLLANGQLGFWYPPHMLLRHFLPGAVTLNISLLFHALLGGIGMLYFLQNNKLHPIAASVGGILFPLGATMVGKYESLNLILPFMWVPLLLLLLQQYMETGKAKYFFWWIGGSSMSILLGHPQIAVYILILNGIFVACLTALSWKRWPLALKTLLGVVLIVALTSFHWLPIIDNLENTDRASGTLKPNAQGMFDSQFSPEAFLGLFIPHPFGHHETYHGPTGENELSSYYGPIALLIALVGLIATRKTFSLWWVALVFVVVGLALATGGYSPLFTFIVRHGWTYFNIPSRFFFYTHVGLVLLIAAGVHVFVSRFKQTTVRGITLLALVLPALLVSWSWHEGVPWKFTKEPVFATMLRQEPTMARVLAGTQLEGIASDENFGIAKWNPLCQTCRYIQTFTSPVDTIDGIGIQVFKISDIEGVITLQLYDKGGERIREVHVAHDDIASNGEWTNVPFEPLIDTLDQEFTLEITSTMETKQAPRLIIHTNPVEQYDPTGRLSNCTSGTCKAVLDADMAFTVLSPSEGIVYHDALAPYVAAGFGIGSTQWIGALPILKVKDYLAPFDTWGDMFRGGARTMMNRFGTTHLIGVFPPYRYLAWEDFSLLNSIPHGDMVLRLYRNDQAFPRIHFAQNVKAFISSVDQINTLLRTNSKDQQTILADAKDDMTFDVAGNTLHVVTDERTKIHIQTDQTTDGFLVLRDVWLAGWEARVDNQPTEMYRVDGIFRGLLVPKGRHEVSFVYKPAWIQKAIYIESFALIVLVSLVGFSIWENRARLHAPAE